MSNLIKRIKTDQGPLQIDYNALANLPTIPVIDETFAVSGQAADAKAVGDALDNMNNNINTRFSNPNLLINSDFRNPINQRGETTLTTNDEWWSKVYFIDRWYVQHGATVEVFDGYVKASASPTTTAGYFCQVFEHALNADTYTATINVKSISGTVKVYQTELVEGVNIITTNGPLSSIEIQLMPGSSIELYFAKLEQGSTATPFVPRLYAEELMMCQRYYRYFDRTPIFANSSTSVTYYMPVQFGIPMRTNATKSLIAVLNGSAVEQTDITLVQCVSTVYNVANIQFSKTVGQYGYVTIAFDAEIY